MSVRFTLLSTDKLSSPLPPSEVFFDTVENFPQKPQKVIEVSRRLGSNKLIRQHLGWESQTTISTLTRAVVNEAERDTYIDNILAMVDETTFYEFDDINGVRTIDKCCIISVPSITWKYSKGRSVDVTGTNSNVQVITVQLEIMVDGED